MDGNTEDNIAIEGFLTTSKQKFEPEEPKTLTFVLRNNSDRDIRILTWYTPFEGVVNGHDTPVESSCFSVKRNGGEEIQYDGKMKKRRENPTAESYMNLMAGDSVSVDFDLNQAYQVSFGGKYSVSFTGTSGTSDGSIEFKFGDEDSGTPDVLPHKQKIELPPVDFAVNEGLENNSGEASTAVRSTEGDIARSKSYDEIFNENFEENELTKRKNNASETVKDASAGPLYPVIIGASPNSKQYDEVFAAHYAAYYVISLFQPISFNPNYLIWFGISSSTRLDLVKNNYAKILNKMSTMPFVYYVNGELCESNIFAYTYKGVSVIWLCNEFWEAEAQGINSQTGTIVHEMSHSVAYTDDFTYGQKNCLLLALAAPFEAVMNGDNYEYFVSQ